MLLLNFSFAFLNINCYDSWSPSALTVVKLRMQVRMGQKRKSKSRKQSEKVAGLSMDSKLSNAWLHKSRGQHFSCK